MDTMKELMERLQASGQLDARHLYVPTTAELIDASKAVLAEGLLAMRQIITLDAVEPKDKIAAYKAVIALSKHSTELQQKDDAGIEDDLDLDEED